MSVKEYLEPEETEQLEKAATCLRDQLLFRMLRQLGCRVSEVLGIEVEHVDFARHQVTIEHLKTRFNLACPKCGTRLGKASVFCQKCGGKVEKAVTQAKEFSRFRKLPVDPDTLHLLKVYIDRGGPRTIKGKTLLFNITRQRAWQLFQEYSGKLGLPEIINQETGKIHHVSPHKMRDAFAIHAMKVDDSGDGQRLLQEHLGHASFDTTAKYRKIAGKEHDDWYTRVMGEKQNEDGGIE